jgi:hypothetical protein
MEFDEKILNTAVYKVSNQQAVTGSTSNLHGADVMHTTVQSKSYTPIVDQTLCAFSLTITKSISGAVRQ